LRGARDAVAPEQAYYEPEVLMTGQVLVLSGTQAWPLVSRPVPPPRVVGPTLDAQTVADRIANRARDLASVESVYVKGHPWGFECWIVSNQTSQGDRFHLYDIEWQIMELYPEAGLKFYLVDRQEQLLSQVLTLEPYDALVVVRK